MLALNSCFDIITGAIVGVASFSTCMSTPESSIFSVYFLVELGGVPILLIKLILGVLILILLVFVPNHHLHPFSLPPSLFFNILHICVRTSWLEMPFS